MTITYSLEVSKVRVGGFLKLLARWRGSIYRLLYREMLIFIVLYYAIAALYRHVLHESGRRIFEHIAWYMKDFTNLVPITFVLGFYVSFVAGRWWNQFMAIPWIDRVGLQVAAYIQGADEKGRLMRRAMVRYMNLMSVLTFQGTSTVVKKRFPTMDHLEDSGLLTMEERVALEEVVAPHGAWWIPSAWFASLAMEARKEGRIHDDLHLKSIIDEMLNFRGNCGMVWSYDWISVPLVYTQVVTISVYCFFGACLIGRQFLYKIPNPDAFIAHPPIPTNGTAGSEIEPEADQYLIDYYLPLFTLFQFFFYMGWLKVAEEMICPYGEDDDDFELNWIIDRNVQVGYLMVDKMHRGHPKLVRDAHWDDIEPEVPYTAAAASTRTQPFLGSTINMNINPQTMAWDHEVGAEDQASFIRRRKPSRFHENDEGDDVSPPMRPKFLKGLIPGNSRLSINMGSKNSLMSGFESIRGLNGGLRSPSFLGRQRSVMSAISQHVFHRNAQRPSVSHSRAESRTGSIAGDLAFSASRLQSTSTIAGQTVSGAPREEDLLSPARATETDETSPAPIDHKRHANSEERRYNFNDSMSTVAEGPELNSRKSSATFFVEPEPVIEEGSEKPEEPEDLIDKLSEVPTAAYDNPPGQSLLEGVTVLEGLEEVPEETEAAAAYNSQPNSHADVINTDNNNTFIDVPNTAVSDSASSSASSYPTSSTDITNTTTSTTDMTISPPSTNEDEPSTPQDTLKAHDICAPVASPEHVT